ncbi:MAG: hypothetical protein DCF15_07535, partial [Phormidesmis priestleyi]
SDVYGPELSEWEETVTKTSYEMRSHLSSILGILNLLADGTALSDDPHERTEMTASAYDTTLTLLKVVEDLEKSGRKVLN